MGHPLIGTSAIDFPLFILRFHLFYNYLSKMCSNLYFAAKIGQNFPKLHRLIPFFLREISHRKTHTLRIYSTVSKFKGALDNFSLIPNFFSKKLRFLYH